MVDAMAARPKGLNDLEGVVRATAPTSLITMAASSVLEMIDHINAGDQLIDAVIALAWSEAGTVDVITGKQARDDFDEWPEMDALVALLDQVRPGWREKGPPA